MRVVVALGGNALLRRGEPMTAAVQRLNVRRAARALVPIAEAHDLVITHGNGPQVGLLALQAAAYQEGDVYPLDILGAETEGMIGYLIEQELGNLLPFERPFATILTQVEVDPTDPAFDYPTKPIGPIYDQAEADRLAAERDWAMAPDGDAFRRVVASPQPKRIFEVGVVDLLLRKGVVVICAGGGGIPTMYREDGSLTGVEAVIDKDRVSALLAQELEADAFLMLTDADAVYEDWATPDERAIRRASPDYLRGLDLPVGSMGPKVESACRFVEQTGGLAGIGSLEGACGVLEGIAGTVVTKDSAAPDYA